MSIGTMIYVLYSTVHFSTGENTSVDPLSSYLLFIFFKALILHMLLEFHNELFTYLPYYELFACTNVCFFLKVFFFTSFLNYQYVFALTKTKFYVYLANNYFVLDRRRILFFEIYLPINIFDKIWNIVLIYLNTFVLVLHEFFILA